MASLTQWTWVWANSKRQWRIGKPGVLQSMGSQTVRHDWVTEQQQILFIRPVPFSTCNVQTEISQSFKTQIKSFITFFQIPSTKVKGLCLCTSLMALLTFDVIPELSVFMHYVKLKLSSLCILRRGQTQDAHTTDTMQRLLTDWKHLI